VLALVAACGACNNPSNLGPDAPPRPDAALDAFMCPANRFFTGQYIDWDSNNSSNFCGIYSATFAVHGDASNSKPTNPNGRFQICLDNAIPSQIDITPSTTASQCTVPASTYPLPGLAIADPEVITTGQLISMQNFTVAREATLGFTVDTSKAFVYVNVDAVPPATRAAVSITSSSDPAQAYTMSTGTWAAGTTGDAVFFPNVDPTGGTTTVSMPGATVGAGSVPIVAGTISYVTIVAM